MAYQGSTEVILAFSLLLRWLKLGSARVLAARVVSVSQSAFPSIAYYQIVAIRSCLTKFIHCTTTYYVRYFYSKCFSCSFANANDVDRAIRERIAAHRKHAG
jgi:hypothetical protein